MVIDLPDEQSTWSLGEELAKIVQEDEPAPIFLEGDLGTGKTFLVRALVKSLPGGEQAQISSPSFNILNIYPAHPQVAHFDLYRAAESGPDESLDEFLSDPSCLVILEWAQYLPESFWPDEYLHILLQFQESGRKAYLTGKGTMFQRTINRLKEFKS